MGAMVLVVPCSSPSPALTRKGLALGEAYRRLHVPNITLLTTTINELLCNSSITAYPQSCSHLIKLGWGGGLNLFSVAVTENLSLANSR